MDDGVSVLVPNKIDISEKGHGRNASFGLFVCKAIFSLTGTMIAENGLGDEGPDLISGGLLDHGPGTFASLSRK